MFYNELRRTGGARGVWCTAAGDVTTRPTTRFGSGLRRTRTGVLRDGRTVAPMIVRAVQDGQVASLCAKCADVPASSTCDPLLDPARPSASGASATHSCAN